MSDHPRLVSEGRHRLRVALAIRPPFSTLEEVRQIAESQRAIAVSLGVRVEYFAVSEDDFQIVPAGGRVAV